MRSRTIAAFAALLLSSISFAQSIDTKYFNRMEWRMIGPHRGGRTVGAVGVPLATQCVLHRREQWRRLEDH